MLSRNKPLTIIVLHEIMQPSPVVESEPQCFALLCFSWNNTEAPRKLICWSAQIYQDPQISHEFKWVKESESYKCWISSYTWILNELKEQLQLSTKLKTAQILTTIPPQVSIEKTSCVRRKRSPPLRHQPSSNSHQPTPTTSAYSSSCTSSVLIRSQLANNWGIRCHQLDIQMTKM
jgi:hypothetical protein